MLLRGTPVHPWVVARAKGSPLVKEATLTILNYQKTKENCMNGHSSEVAGHFNTCIRAYCLTILHSASLFYCVCRYTVTFVQPNAKQLTKISELLDAGTVKLVVHKVWPLEEAG